MTATPRGRVRNRVFDLLRILFAVLVILAHAPEMLDGNRSRELFTRLTHSSMTLGDVSVDGFFLLSGYLLIMSWQRKPVVLDFLLNRFLRIVPGYVVAATLSTIAVGLLAPGVPAFFHHFTRMFPLSLLLLRIPTVPPVLPGLVNLSVNGSMWTISYEFRCYLLVALFGTCGLLRKPLVWNLVAAVLVVLNSVAGSSYAVHWHQYYLLIGYPPVTLRVTAAFFVGGCFYFVRNRLPLRPWLAIVVAAYGIPLLFIPEATETAIMLAGGYFLFYLGLLERTKNVFFKFFF